MVIHYTRNNALKLGIHIFIWVILFLFPYLVFPRQDNEFRKLLTYNWVPLFQYAIIFYLNYFGLLNKYLFQKKYTSYILINAAIILVFLWLNWEFRHLFLHAPPPPDTINGGLKGPAFPMKDKMMHFHKFFIYKNLFSFFVPVIFSIAVKATENWIQIDAEKKEIENKNLESELQHLKYQLQPHFFFNSLNNIYSLAEVSASRTQEAIHSLSLLMRYLLYDTKREKVELSQEIYFLKKYIQLMELRQTEKTSIQVIFPEKNDTTYYIAPLLLIPMIENAYKHGVSATETSHLSFEITIKEKQLYFFSENTNFPKNDTDKSGSGIGLDNLKKRLELLYPKKHELKKGIKGNMYWISLQIDMD